LSPIDCLNLLNSHLSDKKKNPFFHFAESYLIRNRKWLHDPTLIDVLWLFLEVWPSDIFVKIFPWEQIPNPGPNLFEFLNFINFTSFDRDKHRNQNSELHWILSCLVLKKKIFWLNGGSFSEKKSLKSLKILIFLNEMIFMRGGSHSNVDPTCKVLWCMFLKIWLFKVWTLIFLSLGTLQ